jgi:hypothetical protein
MADEQKLIPVWILIVSGFFAVMELIVSISLCVAPASVVDTVDLDAKGVSYLIYMWATRQFALGVIFAFATFKRSASMLTITYIFFLVMFAGDFIIGILENENSLIIAAIVMCAVSSVLLFFINKKRVI